MTTNPKNPHVPVKGKEVENYAYQRAAAEGYLDAKGREMPSSVPIAPPIGYKRTPSLAEQIRAMVVSEKLRQEAMQGGFETFEESDDFDIEDDPADPLTPYEAVFDPLPPPSPTEAPQTAVSESTAISPPVDTKTPSATS